MRTSILRTFAAAAVAGTAFSLAFSAPSAQAACLPTDPSATCLTFDPDTVSSLSGRTGFTGAFSPANPYTQARVGFSFTGSWTTPPSFDLSGISLTGNGIGTSLAMPTVTVNTPSIDFEDNRTAWVNLTSPVSSLNFNASSLSFLIPANVAAEGATISAVIQYRSVDANGATLQLNSSSNNFKSTAVNNNPPVPGPLPVLGSGIALGFSRRLRRRIRLAA
jgi:hypothetical protein